MFDKKTKKQDVLVENEHTRDTVDSVPPVKPEGSPQSHARNEAFEHGNHPQHAGKPPTQNLTNNSLVDPANQPENDPSLSALGKALRDAGRGQKNTNAVSDEDMAWARKNHPELFVDAAAKQQKELQDKALPVILVPAPSVADDEAIRGEQEAQRRRDEHEANLKRNIVGVHSSQQKPAKSMRNVGEGAGRTVKPA